MKTRTIFLLLITFSFSFKNVEAQAAPNKTDANGKKQGHWIKLDANHKKIYDGNFLDGTPIGTFTYYYDNGIQKAVSTFSDNGKVCYTKIYDAGGNISGKGKYVNEKRDSIWTFYNTDGKVISDELYVNGAKNGICHVFYDNGQLAEEKMWKDGKPNGMVKKYFMSGQLKYNGTMVMDKVEGKITFYYPSGVLQAEGMYKEDVKDGDWKYYEEDGKIKRIDKFIMGRQMNAKDDYIKKEDEQKAREQSEQLEIKDPTQDGYQPPH